MTRELLVSRVGADIWSAVREDGNIVELAVEGPGRQSRVGERPSREYIAFSPV